ncbi:MAG: hypothetical protein EOO10_06365 [Chitinophagaceae bacterium]|nr:MAG: hypothetical protein EOO10_06365 [Chitinophagaceae bacterium]
MLGCKAFFFLQLLCLSAKERSIVIRGDAELRIGDYRFRYSQQELIAFEYKTINSGRFYSWPSFQASDSFLLTRHCQMINMMNRVSNMEFYLSL